MFKIKSLKSFTSLLLTLFLLAFQVRASVGGIAKWEVIDVYHQAKVQYSSPFTEDIMAYFTHESGETKVVPLVFDGEKGWLLRFSSGLIGKWTYQIDKQNDFHINTGEVRVVANKDKTNHGALVLDENNKQAFSYEDGSPYFLLAYELDWLFALDYDNHKSTPKSEHLLTLIKSHGFNHVIMNVYAHDVSWNKDEKLKNNPEHDFGGKQTIFPFKGSNSSPDFTQLNIEFFQKFDRTIQLLHNKRINAHVMIYVWNKMVNWPAMNSTADNMYFDYVVKRYSAYPNVVWDISKEALYYGRADEAYIKNRIERLRKLDNFSRLVTVHDYQYCSKHPEQVDFISTQDWGFDIYNRMLSARNRFPNKAIFNIEHGGYEESPYVVFPGDYTDAEVAIRRNWLTLFAGVYSTYYWQATSWNVIIYNPFEQPESFIKPKFEYFSAMSTFFSRFDFAQLKPIPEKNGSGYTLGDNKGQYFIYVSKDNYQMSRGDWYLQNTKDGVEFDSTQQQTYQWFNTLTGEFTEAKKITKGLTFISPWRGKADAILISQLMNIK